MLSLQLPGEISSCAVLMAVPALSPRPQRTGGCLSGAWAGGMQGGRRGTDVKWLPQQRGGDQRGEQRWECFHGNGWSAFLTWAGDAAVLTNNYLLGAGAFKHNVPGVPVLSLPYITYFISS